MWFLILLLFLPIQASALNSDKQQPAYIQADSATLNHKTGICIYRGNVKLTQGTTIITADILTIYTNAKNQLKQAKAEGKLATYSTLPDNSTLQFMAVAETINYNPLTAYVELIGQAKATQGADIFAGPQINYDVKQQIVTTPRSKQGRTTIVIQPGQQISLPK